MPERSIQWSSKRVLSDEFEVEHFIVNIMVLLIQFAEFKIGSQHTWTFRGNKIDGLTGIFFEYVAVTKSTNFIRWLRNNRFVMPVSIVNPFDH